MSFRTLSAKVAAQVDEELMSTGAFSIDQLMELAGLAVAEATLKSFPKAHKVLVVVGPGNNGGDGLVAARHLKLWGFQPSIYYPKRSPKPLLTNLNTQLTNLGIEFIEDLHGISRFELIIDAIFGFSFQAGSIREPYASAITAINEAKEIPVLSVDVPSGWDVDGGSNGLELRDPTVLVSLTAPKPVAKRIDPTKTQHFVGGRFIGKEFADKYGIDHYSYVGYDQVLKL